LRLALITAYAGVVFGVGWRELQLGSES